MLEHKDWLSREIGDDFAQVLDVISGLDWTGPKVGDEQVGWLTDRQSIFATLRRLDLSDSRITDDGLLQLAALSGLKA